MYRSIRKEIAGREVFGKRQNDDKHGVRAKIQVSDYDWGEDRPIRHPWNEVVSYSIHVRGALQSTVPQKCCIEERIKG